MFEPLDLLDPRRISERTRLAKVLVNVGADSVSHWMGFPTGPVLII